MTNINYHSNLINQFKSDKEQIEKIRQQSRIVCLLNEKVLKKDVQIQQLQRVVRKYKKYYDDYDAMKASIAAKNADLQRIKQENSILYEQVNKSVQQSKEYQEKLLAIQKQRHQLIKERNSYDKRVRDIQETFQEYQETCKAKQKQLLNDLQKCYHQIQQLNHKLDDTQKVLLQNEAIKTRISKSNKSQLEQTNFNSQNTADYINMSLQNPPGTYQNAYISQSYQPSNRSFKKNSRQEINKSNQQDYNLVHEIERLRKDLAIKQQQLQRAKALSHSLSVEFDKSVSQICEFQKQLSAYRKENHELKKTLSLFVQRQQYQKMHRNRIAQNQSQSNSAGQYQEQSEGHNIGYSHFTESQR